MPGATCPPGRKDVTLRKLDIKVETVNREPLTLHTDREEDTASVSTATRVMKAIYSVRDIPQQGSPHSAHPMPTGARLCLPAWPSKLRELTRNTERGFGQEFGVTGMDSG
ncbi:hypothetical protein WISP_00979 [Willisornis vidua]|uniref:Uncharacterized protein n=1 Tax=Willisornis vidua TaxID=1566151 RepID=A0ABQ9DZ88_9PASS|nr:hypothetical protein WISP_00979 [Willisornis vidua]